MDFYCEVLETHFKFPETEFQSDQVYRNYHTIIQSQNLLDDILDAEDDQDNVRSVIDVLSGIEKDNNFFSRPFKYAQAYPTILREDLLRPFTNAESGKFGPGRFGDGFGYGVFYAALDIETSIKESLFHAKRDFHERHSKMEEEVYIQERKLIKVGFRGTIIDLTQISELQAELTSENYKSCQALGQIASESRLDALKAPSARSTGTCLPIFRPEAIRGFDVKESFVFNFQIRIHKKDPSKIHVEEMKTRIYDASELTRTESGPDTKTYSL